MPVIRVDTPQTVIKMLSDAAAGEFSSSPSPSPSGLCRLSVVGGSVGGGGGIMCGASMNCLFPFSLLPLTVILRPPPRLSVFIIWLINSCPRQLIPRLLFLTNCHSCLLSIETFVSRPSLSCLESSLLVFSPRCLDLTERKGTWEMRVSLSVSFCFFCEVQSTQLLWPSALLSLLMADGSRETKYFLKIEEDKTERKARALLNTCQINIVWLPRSGLDSRVVESRPETTTQSCLSITSIFRPSIWLLSVSICSQLALSWHVGIAAELALRDSLCSDWWSLLGCCYPDHSGSELVSILHLFSPASFVDLILFLFSMSSVTDLSGAADQLSHSIGCSDTSEYCNYLHVIYANITVCKEVIRKLKGEKWWHWTCNYSVFSLTMFPAALTHRSALWLRW